MLSIAFLRNVVWKAGHKILGSIQYPLVGGRKRLLSAFDLEYKPGRVLYDAFIQYWKKEYEARELQLISSIEDTRHKLYRDATVVERIDYGTGVKDKLLAGEGSVSNVTIKALARGSSKPAKELSLLFYIIKELKPGKCLEMGTCFGISAGYQAAALLCNNYGFLITIEGAPAVAEIAQKHISEWGLHAYAKVEAGSFNRKLLPALLELGSLDFVFIDGHHDGTATLEYLNTVIPFLNEGAIIIFDDIDRSAGMWRAWSCVKSRKDISLTVRMNSIGIAVFGHITKAKKQLTI